MRISIMQPYFLPYIGYIQLLAASDVFVVYDDVNFINRGWINRNNLLLNGAPHRFTIPLVKASQNKKINEIGISGDEKWRDKLLRTIEAAYKKAPHFQKTFSWLQTVLTYPEKNLGGYVAHSLEAITQYLELPARIVPSSTIYQNQALKAGDRLMDVCKQEGAEVYINPSGGQELYTKEQFASQEVNLQFLIPKAVAYPQAGVDKFVPWLSILDALMNCTPEEIRSNLLSTNAYELI
ncbi:MAG: WbqC family protein [Bacteroidota bacterium]